MNLVDKKLLYAILTIIIFGLIMVFSASYHIYGFNFFFKQLGFVVLGLMVSSAFLTKDFWFSIDTNFLFKYSNILWGISLVLLALVLVPIIGSEVNGSTRWLKIPLTNFKFQPSEMAKLVIIIAMARMIVRQEIHNYLGTNKTLILISSFAILLLLEVDFGVTILITTTALAMIFIAGTGFRYWIFAVFLILLTLVILIYLTDNRFDRIVAFVSGGGGMDEQRLQAMIGIVRGGWFGIGIGASLQKISKLPEAHNDMIFAIIGEETGIFGMLVLSSLFIYIFYKGFKISQIAIKKGREFRFQSYLAFGITFILSIQTMLNLSVNLSLLPPKGITLPLVSYGGSSMLFTIIMLAILLRVDIENKQKKYE